MGDELAAFAGKCVYLYSSQSSNQLTIVAQRKVDTQLEGLKINVEKVDGMAEENKAVRKAIWEKVGCKPGSYPILLNMATGNGYDLEAIQELIDLEKLPSVCVTE